MDNYIPKIGTVIIDGIKITDDNLFDDSDDEVDETIYEEDIRQQTIDFINNNKDHTFLRASKFEIADYNLFYNSKHKRSTKHGYISDITFMSDDNVLFPVFQEDIENGGYQVPNELFKINHNGTYINLDEYLSDFSTLNDIKEDIDLYSGLYDDSIITNFGTVIIPNKYKKEVNICVQCINTANLKHPRHLILISSKIGSTYFLEDKHNKRCYNHDNGLLKYFKIADIHNKKNNKSNIGDNNNKLDYIFIFQIPLKTKAELTEFDLIKVDSDDSDEEFDSRDIEEKKIDDSLQGKVLNKVNDLDKTVTNEVNKINNIVTNEINKIIKNDVTVKNDKLEKFEPEEHDSVNVVNYNSDSDDSCSDLFDKADKKESKELYFNMDLGRTISSINEGIYTGVGNAFISRTDKLPIKCTVLDVKLLSNSDRLTEEEMRKMIKKLKDMDVFDDFINMDIKNTTDFVYSEHAKHKLEKVTAKKKIRRTYRYVRKKTDKAGVDTATTGVGSVVSTASEVCCSIM